MKTKHIARMVGIGTAVTLASTGAAAQGVSGTVLGAPDPGGFAASFDIGVVGIQMPRFRYGDVYGAPFASGSPSIGAVFDERDREGGIAPALAFGWGLPGGMFGQRAELFGRFAFGRATESGTFGQPQGVVGLTLPLVNPSVPNGFTGITTGVGSIVPTFDRTFTSYDGQIGGRLHIRNGAWSWSPGVYIGYQRANLDESVGIIPLPGLNFNVNSGVHSDYYQVGLALGGTYNMNVQWALFGVVQGGLDYVRSRLDTSSTLFFSGKGLGPVNTASASDRDNRVSGRVALRAGVAWSPTPNVTISFAGLLQYIGSVSNVVYPTHNPATSTFPSNGTVPAHLDSQGQLNFGGAVGGTIRF